MHLKFKDIRYLLYSSVTLVVDNDSISDVQCNDSKYDKYDNYEVIGIRALTRIPFPNYTEPILFISLKYKESEV